MNVIKGRIGEFGLEGGEAKDIELTGQDGRIELRKGIRRNRSTDQKFNGKVQRFGLGERGNKV